MIVATLLAAALLFLQPFDDVTEDQVKSWIVDYSLKYEIDSRIPMAVARCESIYFDPDVINNRLLGRAREVGTFQFHPRGLWFHTPQYEKGYSMYDQEANVAAGVWGLANGYARQWTCYAKRSRYMLPDD